MFSIEVHHILTLIFIGILCQRTLQEDPIYVGGIFETGENELQNEFTTYITTINERLKPIKLIPVVENVPKYDSLAASVKVCSLLSRGAVAIFGPQSGASSAHVGSICETLTVPHFETQFKYLASPSNYTLRMFPDVMTVVKGFNALITDWQWNKYGLLYEYGDALVRFESLFDTSSASTQIVIQQLPFHSHQYYSSLEQLRNRGIKNIIIDCESINRIQIILKQAQQLGMMIHGYHYLITNIDSDHLNFDDFRFSDATIVFPSLSQISASQKEDTPDLKAPIYLMRNAIAGLGNGIFLKVMESSESTPASCENEINSQFGASLISHLTAPSSKVLPFTLWKDATLPIHQLQRWGIPQIGSIHLDSEKQSATFAKTIPPQQKLNGENDASKHLRVAVIVNAPYVMLKNTSLTLQGNNKFYGFCIDILKEIASQLGLTYTIYVVPDGSYGRYNPITGKWTGIVGEMVEKRADVGLGDLTLTVNRKQEVDFSQPFMNSGINVVMRTPKLKPPHLFSFLKPFSTGVWFTILVAFFVVSFLLFILARFSHNDWRNKTSGNQPVTFQENHFGVLNSMWFIMGSLFRQPSDNYPKGIATRIVVVSWWFFSMIIVSTYMAHLFAFGDLEEVEHSIKDVRELANQQKIKYGCVRGGATCDFFERSPVPLYQQMHAYMTLNAPSTFVSSYEEGIRRAKEENYAFIMESASTEYITERDCDLQRVGHVIDYQLLGVMFPKGSPLRNNFTEVILHLKGHGVLSYLKDKYWKHKKSLGHCERKAPIVPLHFARIGGIFIALLCFVLLAFGVGVLEVLWNLYRQHNYDRDAIGHEFWEAVRFLFTCKNKKLIRRNIQQLEIELVDE